VSRPFKKYDRVLYEGDICFVCKDENPGKDFLIEWTGGWEDKTNSPADYTPRLNARYWWVSPSELKYSPLRKRIDYRTFIRNR